MNSSMDRLLEIMARLRGPGGCPWDIEQTHQSITPQLIEECYELVEAIESGAPELMCEELGDVLLHVVFHCQLAREIGRFDFEKVVTGICEKLVRRHPHVFGDTTAKDSAEVLQNWQAIKQQEKPERTGVLDGVPAHLPALMQAQEISKKAARVGFDWPDVAGARAKVLEEISEIDAATYSAHRAEEIGDLLFAVTSLARHHGVDAEQALRGATRKFIGRFGGVEKAVQASGQDWKSWSLESLEAEWQKQKVSRAEG
jgi:tetrapyrrole methylase family protein / MazG family protein